MRLALPSAATLALAIWVILHLPLWTPGIDGTEGDRFYAEQIRSVSFEETPNVYFISFDGLGPQSLGQEYLDIETTDLIDLINAEFRRFPNLFAEARWSGDSLAFIASLHRDIYWEALGRDGQVGIRLAGEAPNPLYDIFQDNGYETTFGYHSAIFGRSKGPYLDNLLIARARVICFFLGAPRFSFWGYCNLPVSTTGSTRNAWWTDSHAGLMDRVISITERDGPQFAFVYFRLPAHTAATFDYDDPRHVETYRADYIRLSNHAAVLLAELIVALEEKDPEAIVFVFGDHGPRLTINMEFADDPGFFVKDSYGVLGGIWPPDACASWFDDELQKGWLTTLDAVHAILRCLSGGDEVVVKPTATTMHRYHFIPDDDPERSFADFLYE